MDYEEARRFMEANHRGIVTTYRRSGTPQMSILLAGPFRGGAAFVAREATAKVNNLRRDPRCAVLTVSAGWSSYVVVEGTAEVLSWDNTDHEELRLLLREVYGACGGDHPDYEEFDRVMREERRVVVIVRPGSVYGLVR